MATLAWQEWLGSLPPELQAGVAEFMSAMQTEFLANDDLIRPENWMQMTTADTVAWFSTMGIDWATAIAAGFTSINLAFIFGQHVYDATQEAARRGTIGLGIGSPSKVFMKIGSEVGRGFNIGIDQELRKTHQLFAPTSMLRTKVAPPTQMIMPAPSPASGPTIQIINPQHKDDDVIDGVQKGMILSGLVRAAETSPGND
jgi:hypothetical protein